jgi:hypothetical protein
MVARTLGSRLGLLPLLGLSLIGGAGCSIRAEQLKAQPLAHTQSVDAARQTDKKFLVQTFEDLRGGEYGYLYPTSIIPVVNFFHIGAYNKYPEQAGILRASRGGRATVSVGALDSAMPFLLSDMMRKMRFTSNATPLDETNTKVDLRGFDYVVTGKLTNTRFSYHVVMVPLALLGILGVPYTFTFYDLDYEVAVALARDPGAPFMRKTYTFSDSTVVGLYYGQSAAFDMFIGGLEKTLPAVVQDIAQAVAATPVAPPPPPPPEAPPAKGRPKVKGKVQ